MKELKDWNDISLSQYYKIKELLEEPDEWTTYNIIDLLYSVDSVNLPLTELKKYNNALEFLNKEVPVVNIKPQYKINGVTYNSNFNLTQVTAAQFIDYQNYIGTEHFEDYLSVFFIPEGHNYNDGYDIEQVKKDLLELDFPTVKSVAFFFTIFLAKLQNSFLSYLKKDLRKMKMEKEKRKEIEELIDKLEKTNLELFQ